MSDIKESILFVSIVICLNTIIITAEKNYKFVTINWEKVMEEEQVISSDLTYEKDGDDIIFNGKLTQLVDIDNDWLISTAVERSAKDGKFVQILAFPPRGVCDLMSTHYKNYFYETLKQHSNAPDPDKCPVISETYTVNNYRFDINSMRKRLHPGLYRIRLKLLKDNETKAEYILDGEVVNAD